MARVFIHAVLVVIKQRPITDYDDNILPFCEKRKRNRISMVGGGDIDIRGWALTLKP